MFDLHGGDLGPHLPVLRTFAKHRLPSMFPPPKFVAAELSGRNQLFRGQGENGWA